MLDYWRGLLVMPLRPHLKKYRGVGRSCIDEQSGDLYSANVRDGDGSSSRLRHQICVTQTEHHGVCVGDINRSAVLINARRQDEILAGSQRGINLGQGARWRSD